MTCKTEDQVRDEAKIILGFDEIENGVQQGTGQITTFNQLGFKGVMVNLMDGIFLMMQASQRLFWKQNRRRKN